MIRAVDGSTLPLLRRFCDAVCGPYACRIRSLADAYGTGYPFARFWIQESGGQITAAVSALDSSYCLCAVPESDPGELTSFWRMSGGSELAAGKADLERLSLTAPEQAVLLCTEPIPHRIPPGYTAEENPSPLKLYPLLKSCERPGFSVPAVDAFYPDLSHRMRHGTARSLALLDGSGAPASCALTSSETEWGAVISAVACRPDSRGRGLASAAVSLLAQGLSRPVYLFCMPPLVPFYLRLGFSLIS